MEIFNFKMLRCGRDETALLMSRTACFFFLLMAAFHIVVKRVGMTWLGL